jgi:hypothetical protein
MSSDQIRALPLWIQIVAPILFCVLVLGTPFVSGYLITRARRAEGIYAVAKYHEGDEADEKEAAEYLPSWIVRDQIKQPQAFGALDVTFAGTVDGSPTLLGFDAAYDTASLVAIDDQGKVLFLADPNESVPASDEPTEENPIVITEPQTDPAEDEEIPLNNNVEYVIGEATKEWSLAEIWEGELAEPKSEALMAFEADPLGAWYVPTRLTRYSATS